MTARERAKLLRPQAIPLWLGVAPLLMFLIFGLRSGTGLSPLLLVSALFGVVSFAVSVGYHFFCRASIPKVVIKPMPYWRGASIVALLLPFTLVNLWGSGAGYSLMLSPNGMENVTRWLRVVAKMLLGNPIAVNLDQLPKVSAFVTQGPFLGGALWGALGFAVIFAVAGMGFAAVRQEAFDPRQEPFGGSSSWPFYRMAIGYYYGMSLGFWFGAAGIWLGHKLFAGSASVAPSIQAMLTALGIVPDPNIAFTNAVSTAGWLVAFSTLFLGKADFTVGFSDPRPEEREPDMKIKIPELPKTPEPEFDFASIGHETEQIAQGFAAQLSDLARQLGFLDPVEPASTLAASAQEDHTNEPDQEPAVANVISARRPDFDVSFDSAMGQLSNVYVQVSAQLGSTELPLTDWLTLAEGSILELPRPKDNSVTLCINGKPVGKGRAVMIEDHKAIKVLRLSADATQNLGR